ncbi:Fe2+-dependent dioxygenase [Massilia sp. W12]|uniref:Fe2+-dependent dioxygenase n=1 Tax=Massilia sp. W12 TaxID=3126507 RepID=UPI0030D32394
MLLTLPDVLSPGQVRQARTLLSQARWEDGANSAGSQAAAVKANRQLAADAAELPALRAMVLQALQGHAQFFAAALPRHILPPMFNRHSGDLNHYGAHADCALHALPGGGWLRADLSATLFLSEPDDYQGGALRIHDTFGVHDVKLPAGSLVLYPSSSIHEVQAVTGGERLACFMFIQSLVRDAGQRRLLYEMDMALLSLRAQAQDASAQAALTALTGTYHNLLRMWGEN